MDQPEIVRIWTHKTGRQIMEMSDGVAIIGELDVGAIADPTRAEMRTWLNAIEAELLRSQDWRPIEIN
jgi:hypothetical protein